MIKINALTDHTGTCRYEGSHQTECLVFQINYKFYILIYCPCWSNGWHHLDFKENIFSQVCKKIESESIVRGYSLDTIHQNSNLDKLLERKITEVCCTYCDNAGKVYSFTKEHTYLDFIKLSSCYSNELDNTIKSVWDSFLNENNKRTIVEKCKNLFINNDKGVTRLNDSMKIKLNDLLTQKILQYE